MGIRMDQVNIVVRDMDAMAAFYTRLGVEIRTPPDDWAPHHRSKVGEDGLDLDLDSQEFARVLNEGWPGGSGIVIGFRVDSRADVDRLYSELIDAAYRGQQSPYDAF